MRGCDGLAKPSRRRNELTRRGCRVSAGVACALRRRSRSPRRGKPRRTLRATRWWSGPSGPTAELGRPGARGFGLSPLEGEARCRGVVAEHLDGLQRKFVEVLPDVAEFAQQVVRHRDHMAPYGIGMEQVQDLPGAGPEELDVRLGRQRLER